jgi:purine-binding chemotaxis protein CheW
MQILREVQETLGWLSPETLSQIAQSIGWPRAEVEATAETCIIVAHVGDREIGVLVDQVSEVQYFNAADIQDPPAFGQGVDTEFILGIGKVGDHVTLLLDINRVLIASEIADLCLTA